MAAQYKYADYYYNNGKPIYFDGTKWVEWKLGGTPIGGTLLPVPPSNAEILQIVGEGLEAEATKTKIIITRLGKSLPEAARPTTALRYPLDRGGIAADADYVMFQFYDYQPPFGNQRKAVSPEVYSYNQAGEYTKAAAGYEPIIMYMPEDISTGFRAGWTGKSMANLTTDAIRSLAADGIGNKAASLADGVKNVADRGGALFGAASVQKIVQTLSGDSLSYDDIFGGISGAVFNPNTELLFNNIDLRNFSLNFKLVPRSQPEAIAVENIVKSFKKAMLPSKDPGTVMGYNKQGNNNGVKLGFIGVPKLCRVSFMKGPGEHPHLPRFKMCAIVSTDVNYTPDGAYATYTDGRPVAMSLSLNFQETKICFAEDIALGNVR